MTDPDHSHSFWNYLLPWRWAWLGWLTALAFLAAGVPLFLRMPLWCDANLYDTSAYRMLAGGVHYRDVFDTNLPGFVGMLTGFRALLGPSSEVVRAVDLAFVAAIVLVMLRFVASAGATGAARAWAVAAVASFYLFISESNHLQRDVWMMLPVLLASYYRYRRIQKAAGPLADAPPPRAAVDAQAPPSRPAQSPTDDYVGRDWTYTAPQATVPTGVSENALRRLAANHFVTDGSILASGIIEGMIWGAAFWVKPHIVVMAVAVWLVMAMRLAGTSDRPIRRILADIAGVLLGGLLMGGAGIAWLIASGTWEHLLEVFQKWNTQYLANVMFNLRLRFVIEPTYHPPWSMLTLVAVPFAVLNILDGRMWSRRWERTSTRPPGSLARAWRWFLGGERTGRQRTVRALFATLYLSWTAMALFLQREFHYVHVPEVILMIGLFATNGWAINTLAILFQVLASALVLTAVDRPDVPQWRRDLNHWHLRQQEILNPSPFWRDRGYYYLHTVKLNPAFNPDRYRWWEASIRGPVTRELRNGVAFDWDFHGGVDSVQLGAVEDFLRSQNVKDGQVLCWHDSPHALYRRLGIHPGFRFMHVTTASEMGPNQYQWEKEARAAAQPNLRFVVYDLYRVLNDRGVVEDLQHRQVPRRVPPLQRTMFPLNQPILFYSPSGRYVVAAVKQGEPLGECRIPHAVGEEPLRAVDGSHTWTFSNAQFTVEAAEGQTIPATLRTALLGSDRPASRITGGWEVDPATGTLKLSGITTNAIPTARNATLPTAPAGPDHLKIAGREYVLFWE